MPIQRYIGIDIHKHYLMIGGQVQVGAMQTMARMLRQQLNNRILEIGGQAKVKATLVNTLIIVLASLIIVGVPGISLFMSIGFEA